MNKENEVKWRCRYGFDKCITYETDGNGDLSVTRCNALVTLPVTNQETMEVTQETKCADAWQPLLMMLNTQKMEQLSAEISAFRAETNTSNMRMLPIVELTNQFKLDNRLNGGL